MSKSYPFIDVKCNDCGAEIRIELQYEDDADRWTRAGQEEARVTFPKNHEDWDLAEGCSVIDHCKVCREKHAAAAEDEKKSEPDGGEGG